MIGAISIYQRGMCSLGEDYSNEGCVCAVLLPGWGARTPVPVLPRGCRAPPAAQNRIPLVPKTGSGPPGGCLAPHTPLMPPLSSQAGGIPKAQGLGAVPGACRRPRPQICHFTPSPPHSHLTKLFGAVLALSPFLGSFPTAAGGGEHVPCLQTWLCLLGSWDLAFRRRLLHSLKQNQGA